MNIVTLVFIREIEINSEILLIIILAKICKVLRFILAKCRKGGIFIYC